MRRTRNAPIHFGVYRNCSAGNSGLPLLCAYFVAGCCGRRLAPSEAEGPLPAGYCSRHCPSPLVSTVADGFPPARRFHASAIPSASKLGAQPLRSFVTRICGYEEFPSRRITPLESADPKDALRKSFAICSYTKTQGGAPACLRSAAGAIALTHPGVNAILDAVGLCTTGS